MPGLRFEHVGLTVSNLDKMVAFFSEMLDFTVGARIRPFDPAAVAGITGVSAAVVDEVAYVSKGDLTFELLQYRQPESLRSPLRPCDPGYLHWLVMVDDVPGTVARAAAYGFAQVSQPYLIAAGPNAGKRGTYLRHTDGFSLEVIGPAS
jgi:catechol 2,3-dioxygenase-like lactoylglutathione lyase family enzyme